MNVPLHGILAKLQLQLTEHMFYVKFSDNVYKIFTFHFEHQEK